MRDMGHLVEEWRAAVQQEARATGRAPLLLTAAVCYTQRFLWGEEQAYPAASLSRSLDWINIMNYDYHGSWDTSHTGAHSALSDPNNGNSSTTYGLGSWIRAGVPRGKLIMGLPLYGRTWKLKDRRSHGVGAAAVGVGPGSAEPGMLTYAEVVEFNRANKAKVVYDEATTSMYSVAGDNWVGYDDERTVGEKIGYARSLGLRGYFFWAIDGDYNWNISRKASEMWHA